MKHWFLNVCIATALLQAVYHAVRVLVSYRVLALGGDAVTIGIVTALFSLAPLLVAVRIGRAVDRRHAAAILRTGVVLTSLGVLVIAVSSDLIVLGLGNVILGFGQILVTVAAQGFVTLLSPPGELDRGFAGLTLGVSVGQAVGVPLVGLIAAGSSDGGGVETTLALTVMGVVSLAAIPFAWPIRERPQPAESASKGDRQSVVSMISTTGMRPAVFSSLIVLASVDVVVAYLPVLGHEFGFSVLLVTLLLTARTAASIVSRAFLPWLLTRVPRQKLLISATLCSALPTALLPFVPDPVGMALLLVVAGFFWGIGQPLTMTWVAGLVTAANRAAALSLRLTGNRLGQVLIPLTAGAAAGVAGTSSIFVITGGLLGTAAVSTWRAVSTC
ncbi:putative MFS family arabinose efflux permease [Rhodococcus wratislaviensis]|uniref:Major facilitator superfamily multidrug resistance protein n=1 Tax=Rhodococcus wratislaviensis TaxID=44752 RepID=A0AB38FGR1_RHOWR|nr:MFS transporter [Rhodococcus wratislaviensis]REE72834.1 putative MFS family arabinose efflux permease [Rhodococcus wratislaviensis]SPZ40731.1 major facilitator superfamily multidrug resistance protein [Rhodococcus wratislaviensis]